MAKFYIHGIPPYESPKEAIEAATKIVKSLNRDCYITAVLDSGRIESVLWTKEGKHQNLTKLQKKP